MYSAARDIGRLLWLIAAVACISFPHVAAYTEEENLVYIKRIIDMLNNRYECSLPTYSEVDEMQKAFDDLKASCSPAKFERLLTEDMRIVRKTVLDQWSSFQQYVRNDVIIRSAKRRSFLSKIERYQLEKYKDSVCARFKDIRNPKTDKIFEKNPIVRYVKHLETNEVVEHPDNEEQESREAQSGDALVEDEKQDHTGLDAQVPKNEEQQVVYKDPAKGLQSGDHYLDEDGQPKVFLGQFEVDNGSGQHDGERESIGRLEIEQVFNYDPLDEIPVPKSDDAGEEEPRDDDDDEEQPVTTKTDTSTSAAVDGTTGLEPEPESTASESVTEEPLYERRAAYVDIRKDDEDLARVVRLPKKDWEMDEVFGYFKWPDEDKQKIETIHMDQSVRHAWNDFVIDPYAFDKYMAQAVRASRPKINGAVTRHRKQQLFNQVEDEARRDHMLGWTYENTPEPLKMPDISNAQKKRWVKLLNNNVCKIGYNPSNIKKKTTKGFNAVRSFIGHKFKGNEKEIEFD